MAHYEVEQAGAGQEHEPDVGTHAEPERWHVVNVFNADAVPMPLTFDTLDQDSSVPGAIKHCDTAVRGYLPPKAPQIVRMFLLLGRLGDRNDAVVTRINRAGHATDGATFASRVPALEHKHN